MIKYILSTLTAVTLLAQTPFAQAASPREYLYSIDRDGDESFVGIMANEDTCVAVAKAMNIWAQLPPVTPLTFVCRPNRITS